MAEQPSSPQDDTTQDAPPQGKKPPKKRAKIVAFPPPAFPRTQLQVAALVVAKHGDNMRWCAEEQAWFTWNGNVWEKNTDEHCSVYVWTRETIIGLLKTAIGLDDDAQRKACLELALKWQNHASIVAVMQNIKSDVTVALTAFDTHPLLLTVQNGTIDLTTGVIRESRREDYITKEAPTIYDPSARSEKWAEFVAWRCKNSPEFMAYQQRLAGSCLTGDVGDQNFYIDVGDGGNGKSTFWGAIFAALGPYAVPVKPDTIMDAGRANNGGAPRSDIMELKGARLALVAEGEDGQRLAEGLTKLLTGGDMITARSPYGRKEVKFWPTHKLIMFTNHVPVIRGSDDGIWRRVHLIPSDASIEKDVAAGIRAKEKLMPIFEKERASILNWLIEGCIAWQRQGIGTCQEVRDATRAYKAEMDLIGNFLIDHLVERRDLIISCKELYEAYQAWCDANGRGRTALPKQRFEADIKKRGAYTERKHANSVFWIGLDAILARLLAESAAASGTPPAPAQAPLEDNPNATNPPPAETSETPDPRVDAWKPTYGVVCPNCRATGNGVRVSAKLNPDDPERIGFCTHCQHTWKVW